MSITTTIFNRNVVDGAKLGETHGLGSFYQYDDDPLSTHYVYPEWYNTEKKVTSWSLAKWLLEVHQRRGWVPYFSDRINMRHASPLLRQYDVATLIRAIHFASQVATRPFSFKLVKKCLSEKFLGE